MIPKGFVRPGWRGPFKDGQELIINEVREKLMKKNSLADPNDHCDFHVPWENQVQVGDLQNKSLVWLLSYREVQETGIQFST